MSPGDILSLPVRRWSIRPFNKDCLGASQHREGREGFLEERETLGTLRRNMGATLVLGAAGQAPEGPSKGVGSHPLGPESPVRALPMPRGSSPASPVEKTLLDTVTLSSGTLVPSPVARQPFMGKLMSEAPLAGSLWMLRTVGVGGGDAGQEGTETGTEWLHDMEPRPRGAARGSEGRQVHGAPSLAPAWCHLPVKPRTWASAFPVPAPGPWPQVADQLPFPRALSLHRLSGLAVS